MQVRFRPANAGKYPLRLYTKQWQSERDNTSGSWDLALEIDRTLRFGALNALGYEVTLSHTPPHSARALLAGLRLTISTHQDHYTAGDPIGLTVSVENDGNDTIQVPAASPRFEYSLDVRLPDGRSAPMTLLGKYYRNAEVASYSIEEIRVGESYRFRFLVNRFFDMTAPGQYRIRASVRLALPGKPQELVTASSNEITLTVWEGEFIQPP